MREQDKVLDREAMREWLRARLPDKVLAVIVKDTSGALAQAEINRGETTSLAERGVEQILYELRGKPPTNEEGVLEVGERLARHLSDGDSEWRFRLRDRRKKEVGEDGDLLLPDGTVIGVQVTRALASQDLMANLGREGSVSERRDHADLARDLLVAASNKADLAGREKMFLALDAVRLAHVVFPEVLKAARELHEEFAAIGFFAAYVVGPRDDTVTRLDRDPHELLL